MPKSNITLRPAIFLDRDGTLNVDSGYVHKIEDWQWLEHAKEALKAFKLAGYVLIVVTNQSGIARGFYDEGAVLKLHDFVNGQLKTLDCELIFYYCPHHPDISGPCECRKPLPQMLFQAASDHNIDLAKSWMIGDMQRDIEAGKAAGCKTLLISTSNDAHENKLKTIANLNEAVKIICVE